MFWMLQVTNKEQMIYVGVDRASIGLSGICDIRGYF